MSGNIFFEKIFDEIKNWSDFPADKLERGSLNYITNEIVKNSAAEVKSGRVVRMALTWNTTSAVDNPNPALHYMVEMGDIEAPEPTCNKDFL